jgi:hypothetical protein
MQSRLHAGRSAGSAGEFVIIFSIIRYSNFLAHFYSAMMAILIEVLKLHRHWADTLDKEMDTSEGQSQGNDGSAGKRRGRLLDQKCDLMILVNNAVAGVL